MHKSTTYKAGGLLVTICSSAGLAFISSTGWFTEQIARYIVIICGIGLLAGVLLIFYGLKTQRLEDKQLIKAIPQLLNDINIERGRVTDNFIQNNADSEHKGLELLSVGIADFLSNGEYSDKIQTDDVLDRVLNAFDMIPVLNNKAKTMEDGELGRLLASSAKVYLPTETQLEQNKNYKKLQKQLKAAREKLPHGLALNATREIDNYLNYSQAYWVLCVLVAFIVEPFKEVIPLANPAYQLLRDKIQEQMNKNLAKVGEAVNRDG